MYSHSWEDKSDQIKSHLATNNPAREGIASFHKDDASNGQNARGPSPEECPRRERGAAAPLPRDALRLRALRAAAGPRRRRGARGRGERGGADRLCRLAGLLRARGGIISWQRGRGAYGYLSPLDRAKRSNSLPRALRRAPSSCSTARTTAVRSTRGRSVACCSRCCSARQFSGRRG